jgi:putative acetyltransferase
VDGKARRRAAVYRYRSLIEIQPDDPRTTDVVALLKRHLAFAHEHTPPEHIHALDLTGLLDARVTLFSARRDDVLLGIGALKELDPTHGELKSMHTAAEFRGQGVGRALVDRLLSTARERRYTVVSLETGTVAAFAPARALYASVGFVPCGPFGDYPPSPTSAFMTLRTGW